MKRRSTFSTILIVLLCFSPLLQARADSSSQRVEPIIDVEVEVKAPMVVVKRRPLGECEVWVKYTGDINDEGVNFIAEVVDSEKPYKFSEEELENIAIRVLARKPSSFQTGSFKGEFAVELRNCQSQLIDTPKPNKSINYVPPASLLNRTRAVHVPVNSNVSFIFLLASAKVLL